MNDILDLIVSADNLLCSLLDFCLHVRRGQGEGLSVFELNVVLAILRSHVDHFAGIKQRRSRILCHDGLADGELHVDHRGL